MYDRMVVYQLELLNNNVFKLSQLNEKMAERIIKLEERIKRIENNG